MIFSELRSDTDLLDDVGAAQKVFVMGCPVCANMSLNIQKGAEGSPMLALTPTGYKAVSMDGEVDRLTRLFAGNGADVDSWVGKYPVVALCVLDESTREKIQKRCRGFDTVVVLSCDAGKMSIEGILPDSKTIAGMNAKGIAYATIERKMKFLKYSIDQDSVKIKRFNFDSEH